MARDSGGPAGLGLLMVKGAAWVIGSRMTIRLLGLVSTVILARLLVPADFGIVAMASLLVASIELLSSFNFELWIVRHPQPGPYHYNTAWTLSLMRGLITCAALYLLAEPASIFFQEPRLEAVVIALAAQAALDGLHNIGIVDFQKHLRFEKEFVILAGSKLGAFLLTIGSAFFLRSYWALVIGIVSGTVIKMLMSYWMHPYRPSLSLRFWREIFAFGKWLMFGNLLGFLYRRSDTIILGRLMNSQSLGLYAVAHEISNLATSELVAPIRKVMLPGYAKLGENLEQLRASFLDGLGVILLIGFPVAAGIGLVAEPLVWVLLGENWIEAIPLIRILAIYGLASVAMANQVPLFIALGRTRLLAILTGLGVVMLVPCFIWASSSYGLVGGAWALSLVNIVLFAVSLSVTLAILRCPLMNAVVQIWRTLVATLAMAVAVVATLSLMPATEGWANLAPLAASVGSGALVYSATLLTLWYFFGKHQGPERRVLEFIKRTSPPDSQKA